MGNPLEQHSSQITVLAIDGQRNGMADWRYREYLHIQGIGWQRGTDAIKISINGKKVLQGRCTSTKAEVRN